MTATTNVGPLPRAAHRPSRRHEILAAAMSIFAEHGFVDANVVEIADAAKVSVSSIYYHFETKSQLFEAVAAEVYKSLEHAVAASSISEVESSSATALAITIRTGYRWVDDHPDGSKILYSHLPGVTSQSSRLRDEYEARHVAGASRFLEEAAKAGPAPPVGSPAAQLAARTLVRTMLVMMPLRLEGGMFSKRSSAAIAASLESVGTHIVFA